jgi:hypothetical protein
METSRAWAQRQFGSCQLGDARRTARVVQLAAAMHRAPNASLPQQLKTWAATKAGYRLLGAEAFQYQDLLQPHWDQTRQAAGQHPLVLLVQDVTTLDYTRYQAQIRDLAPIGDNRGYGLQVSTVLAVVPQPRQVLGVAYQQPFLRQPRPAHETRTQRARRAKESDVWPQAVKALGTPPPGVRWVQVGDRGADLYALFDACHQVGLDFLVRACQDRRMHTPQGELTYLKPFASHLPGQDTQALTLPARAGRPVRQVQLTLAFSPLTLGAGWLNAQRPPVPVWVIRVWEAAPPMGLDEPLEWLLLTSVPTTTVADAWERVAWYRCRWLVEDFHQCLKTGCQIEQRRLTEANSLLRLLALLTPLAVSLLALREHTRLEPDQPAAAVVPAELLQVVAHLSGRPAASLTRQAFWHAVAQQGGYLARQRDGPPGWKSLWHGWLYVQTLLRGFQLATHSAPSDCG